MTITEHVPVVAPAAPAPRRRRALGLGIAVAVAAAGFAVPYVVLDRFAIGLLLDGVILALLALGIGYLARHLGLISLGHTAFFGGAAYAVAVATTHWGWSPTAAAVFGLGLGTVLAVAMGALVVRATGMAFLMLTLAFGQAMYTFCVQPVARPLTGGYDGLQVDYGSSTFFGLTPAELMSPGLFWPVAWAALAVSVAALWLAGRSRFGVILAGIKDNRERMHFSGYHTFGPRLAAFVLSGTVSALGGVLFALNAAYVSPETLGFLKAGDSLIAALVGGVGALLGPVLGALLYVLAQSWFNTSGNLHLYTGVALVVVLVFLPGGIIGGIGALIARRRRGREKR